MKYRLIEDTPWGKKDDVITTKGVFEGAIIEKHNYRISSINIFILKKLGVLEEIDARWKPKIGEEYWTIGLFGEPIEDEWYDDKSDEGRYSWGNVHKTEADALAWREKVKNLSA